MLQLHAGLAWVSTIEITYATALQFYLDKYRQRAIELLRLLEGRAGVTQFCPGSREMRHQAPCTGDEAVHVCSAGSEISGCPCCGLQSFQSWQALGTSSAFSWSVLRPLWHWQI